MIKKHTQSTRQFFQRNFIFCSLVTFVLFSSSPSYAVLRPPPKESSTMRALKQIRDTTSEVTENALDLIGIKYKRGGNSIENGLDCSGFVRLVFKNANEAELPRTAKEMSQEGETVSTKDLQPGDLVFFNTLKKSFSHVGIYLGENKFIHSPSPGGKVRIESMSVSYWKKRFNGARRINEESAQN
jgi:cell wall-associated NlpC family hydrolase